MYNAKSSHAIFILVSNVGLAFKVHYCMDAIASISLESLFQTSSSEKNCCGIFEKKASCCTDKVFHFQKKSENTTLVSNSFLPDFTLFFEEWKPFLSDGLILLCHTSQDICFCNLQISVLLFVNLPT